MGKNFNISILVKRTMLVLFGSCLIGIGIAIAMKSNIGADALSLLYSGVMKTLSISFGQANVLVSIVLLLPVIIFDRKHIGLGTIVSPFIVAGITDALSTVTISNPNIVTSFIILLIGLSITAIGIATYSAANLGKSSYDACSFMLMDSMKKSLSSVRIMSDFSICIIGLVLGADLVIGPVVSIVLMGTVIQWMYSYLQKNNLVY